MFTQQGRRGDRGPGEQIFDFSFHGNPAIGADNRSIALRFRDFIRGRRFLPRPGQLL
jgi:hypothetical protein